MNNQQSKIRDITYISLFAALISVSSYISLPIPPVPVTAQTLAIMLAGSLLNYKQAAMSVIVFLLLGAFGVPVFSNGSSGISIILGPTGGYLFGFLAAAIVISLLRGKKNNIWQLGAANLIGGILVVYAFGIPWLAFTTGIGIQKALAVGAIKFLIGDIAKVVLATTIGYSLYKRLPR